MGQMQAAIYRSTPNVPLVNLFADAPAFSPRACSYLLAAYAQWFPPGTVFLCVVDPGVGSSERKPVVINARQRWFVGPDNGLFQIVAQRDHQHRRWEISWRPESLSASFHGRDLFAPVAADLASGGPVPGTPLAPLPHAWPDDLAEIVYVDHYGNLMTGIQASAMDDGAVVLAGGRSITGGRTFADVPQGDCLWYGNSNGLVELAVNCGSAARDLGLLVGDPVSVQTA